MFAHQSSGAKGADVQLFLQAVVSGLSVGAVYALVGVGYNVVFAATRVFNLAQGQILMLGTMFTWQFRQGFGVPTVLAIALGAICAGLANVLVERTSVAPLRASGHGFGGLGTLVTTLGASIVIVNLAQIRWGSDIQVYDRYFEVRGFDLGGVIVTRQQIFMVVAAVVVVVAYQAFVDRTRWGIGLSAMAEDSEAAALRGVPTAFGRSLAFFLGGVISGIGGAAIGPITSANVNLGFEFGLKGFVAVAIGGFGSANGALAGGMVLGISESMLVTYGNDAYRTFAGLGLMLAILLLRPQGILGRLSLRQV
jgi:branched-chain amino acid transport system permease protein